MGEQRRFCTFYLDGHYYGVEVAQVREVLRYQEMTRVPLTPPVIRGLMNLRGEIVPALDLRRRLELTEDSAGQPPMNVVIHTENGPMSLLVDRVGEVVEVDENAFERSPRTLRGVARFLIRGAYKLKDRLLLIL